MLETYAKELIQALKYREVGKVERIFIDTMAQDSTLLIITFSGNMYVIKVINPADREVDIYMCNSRLTPKGETIRSGYIATSRLVSIDTACCIKIDDCNRTSRVTEIYLLEKVESTHLSEIV